MYSVSYADEIDLEYVESSDDDLEEIRGLLMEDEELNKIMQNVFGDSSDEDV